MKNFTGKITCFDLLCIYFSFLGGGGPVIFLIEALGGFEHTGLFLVVLGTLCFGAVRTFTFKSTMKDACISRHHLFKFFLSLIPVVGADSLSV